MSVILTCPHCTCVEWFKESKSHLCDFRAKEFSDMLEVSLKNKRVTTKTYSNIIIFVKTQLFSLFFWINYVKIAFI